MLDALTFSGCLQRIKETAFASSNSSSKPSSKSMKASQQQSKAMQADDDDADDGEAGPSQAHPASAAADLEVALCLCCEALANLAVVVKGVQLRNSQEVLQAGLEGCSDLLSCNKTAKVPASSKKMGLLTGRLGTPFCTQPRAQACLPLLPGVSVKIPAAPMHSTCPQHNGSTWRASDQTCSCQHAACIQLVELLTCRSVVESISRHPCCVAGLSRDLGYFTCTAAAIRCTLPCTIWHGVTPSRASHAGLLSIQCPAGSISTAAYDLLTELFQRRHGCMQDMAALLLPRLTPLMVGAVMQAGKRTASEAAASRAAAVNFVRQVYRWAYNLEWVGGQGAGLGSFQWELQARCSKSGSVQACHVYCGSRARMIQGC